MTVQVLAAAVAASIEDTLHKPAAGTADTWLVACTVAEQAVCTVAAGTAVDTYLVLAWVECHPYLYLML